MLHRTVCIASLLVFTLALHAQVQSSTSREQCPAGNCTNFTAPDRGPVFPSHPSNGKWEMLDFKPGDASVSCSVVKYDVTTVNPVLHLLCPGPQIYAPLRVHLALSWTGPGEIPQEMKYMLVDPNSQAKFKSTPGDARAELMLHAPQQSRTQKEWIRFTKVNVSLVLPPEK